MCLVYDNNVFIYQLNDGLNEYGHALLKKGLTRGGAYSVITKILVACNLRFQWIEGLELIDPLQGANL